MNYAKFFAASVLASVASDQSFAWDSEVADYSVEAAMSQVLAKKELGADVEFYFGGQNVYGIVATSFGEAETNRKNNAYNKSNEQACQGAFLFALRSLRDRARNLGANAVINIRSNYLGDEDISETTYQCEAGEVLAGVSFIGDIVKLERF